MSAMGQKRTLSTVSLYVRFAPESGHSEYRTGCPLSATSGHSLQVLSRHLVAGLLASGFARPAGALRSSSLSCLLK